MLSTILKNSYQRTEVGAHVSLTQKPEYSGMGRTRAPSLTITVGFGKLRLGFLFFVIEVLLEHSHAQSLTCLHVNESANCLPRGRSTKLFLKMVR